MAITSLVSQAATQGTPQPTVNVPAPTVSTPTPDIRITTSQGSNNLVGRVLGASEIEALRDQRSELSNQLISATERRNGLAEQAKSATGADKQGLEDRIRLLDQRILSIEAEIASTGQVLAQSLAASPPGLGDTEVDRTAISIVFTIFVMMPIAIAIARNMWRRGTPAKPNPMFDKENSERLQRLEQAVDSIAIEMERVSEGQRFVTKLLAESADRARLESVKVPRS